MVEQKNSRNQTETNIGLSYLVVVTYSIKNITRQLHNNTQIAIAHLNDGTQLMLKVYCCDILQISSVSDLVEDWSETVGGADLF